MAGCQSNVLAGHPVAHSAEKTLFAPSLEKWDVPVALMHLLRTGVIVSPAGINTSCRVTAGDLLNGIVPFLAWVYCLNDRRLAMSKAPARCLVLLSAIPGAGKSVVASMIEQVSRLLIGYPRIQSVGMDGWHLPNRVIQTRTMTDEHGQIVPLTTRKGSPESFDVKALANDMRSLVWDASPARLPVYDRKLHDPVADAVLVDAPIVLLEGNYLLLPGLGWEGVQDVAGGAAWLDAPVALARQSILGRNTAVGRSSQEAEGKWVSNDYPNAVAALRGRPGADAILHVNADRRVHFLHRP